MQSGGLLAVCGQKGVTGSQPSSSVAVQTTLPTLPNRRGRCFSHGCHSLWHASPLCPLEMVATPHQPGSPQRLFPLPGPVTQVALSPWQFPPAYWVLSCPRWAPCPTSFLLSLRIHIGTPRFFLRFCRTARHPIMAKGSRLGTEHSAVATRAVGVCTPLLIT